MINDSFEAGASGGGEPIVIVGNSLTSNPLTGQVSIASTGTAVQLPAHVVLNAVMVSAAPSNTTRTSTTGGVVGPSGVSQTTGYVLSPGASQGFTVTNSNLLWVNGITGDIFSWAVM